MSCARRLVVSDAPILLLCIARPELLDRRPGCAGGKLNATTVLLEPLTHVGELCARIDEAVVRLFVEPEGAIGRLEVLLEQAMPLFESAGNDFALYNAHHARAFVSPRAVTWTCSSSKKPAGAACRSAGPAAFESGKTR